MMQHMLLKLSDRLPARHIKGENGEPYLERYFIARALGCELRQQDRQPHKWA